jgi:bifunctional non-homologous end joining protein LigD
MLVRARPAGFIEPCLRSTAERPPSGPEWIHEIKHDGYRLMARRDPVGVRLLTRRGHDWAPRFPLIVSGEHSQDAVMSDRRRSCRRRRQRSGCFRAAAPEAHRETLYAFDLLELNGKDMRREPFEVRKATLASLLRSCPSRGAPERAPFARRRRGRPTRLP